MVRRDEKQKPDKRTIMVHFSKHIEDLFEANGETPSTSNMGKNRDLDQTGPELAAKSNSVWVCLGQCFRKQG